ncbi:MAG: HAD-IA family hydrolase [Chloroflexi bacterium]|nr:HAD-IA family hydrolase [Chloroflexota bacterium]
MPSVMIKAILFDLDDTLFSLSGCEAEALRRTLGSVGLLESLPADFVQRYAAISSGYWLAKAADDDTRATRAHIIESSWRDFLARFDLDASRALELAEAFWAAFCASSALNPGAREVVENLAGQYRLGMVTNGYSDSQRGRLAAAGWSDRFDPLLISEEAGVAKPDPRIFQMALERLDLGAADVLYVGDSLSHDREGCLRAGIRFCHYCPDPAPATGAPKCYYRIRNLLDLEGLLRELA